MVNPFDLRTILLAKHAQHVVLIHFPIALFMTGVGLDLLSRGKRNSQFASAAYWNLSIAAAAVIPTVLTGWLAWHFALEDQKIKGLLLLHLLAASTAHAVGDHVMVGALADSQNANAPAAIPNSSRTTRSRSYWPHRTSRRLFEWSELMNHRPPGQISTASQSTIQLQVGQSA